MNSKSLNGLKSHIKYHHNRPRISCDLCEKTFPRKKNILKHMHSYHKSDHIKMVNRNFKCEECDAAFGKERLLSNHVKAMHHGKRWYCHYQNCSTSFSLKSYSTKHFRKFHSLQGGEMIKKYLKRDKNNQVRAILKKQLILKINLPTIILLYTNFSF